MRATGRQPRGWDRMVEELNTAPDRDSFLRGMLDVQSKIVAAAYGALWDADESNQPRLLAASSPAVADSPQDSPARKLLLQGARAGFERQASHVLKIEAEQAAPPGSAGTYLFVTVIRVAGKPALVSTVVADCRDADVLHTTAPLREVAAGLYEGFVARQDSAAARAESGRVRRAMALLGASQEGRGFTGAALNLVNELARQHKCTRVSLGWVRGRSVRLVAMSDTEHLRRHSEQVALIEMAMAECLDQQQPIVQPPPPDAEPLLTQAVVHAHRRITGDAPGRNILSIPLRHADEWLGVVTLERSDEPFDPSLIKQLLLVADVVAPHLADRREGDRWLFVHAWHSVRRAAAFVVGPRHVGWKLVTLLVVAALVYAALGTLSYSISAPFTLEAHAKRVVPVPYKGYLDKVMVEPGDWVKKDDVLAHINDTELKFQLLEEQNNLRAIQIHKQQVAAQAKQAEAQQDQARIEQSQAKIDLLQYQINQSTIRAPIAGVVLAGQWKDKLGGAVDQGTPMFDVAPLDELTAIVRVSERDIDLVRENQTGRLATRSTPEHKFEFTVTRIVPLAGPIEGANVFEVRGKLDEPAAWLRPGMEGQARLDVGPQRIAWIATHRMVDAARLWMWW